MIENEETPSIPATETPTVISRPAPQIELPVLPEPDIQLIDAEFRSLPTEHLERLLERKD